ncbi:hypothetical protein [Timonella sp. A28]|uniref:hypothetical protein n=1 Tax=Timonella sp. A28 TaxID=3442640 RepID=UPI003EBD3F3C
MTAHFDGYDSETLFNSLQEGGQGIFSLMVDLGKVIDLAGDAPSAPLTSSLPQRQVTVGQEVRVELSENSVSPAAGDVTVVWSNGAIGSSYQVTLEDVGTTLSATATFAGEDMQPLEVTIECGDVVLAPAPVIDRSAISIRSEAEVRDEGTPDTGIMELAPVMCELPIDAVSPAVEAVTARWLVGGQEIHSEIVEAHDDAFTTFFYPPQGSAGSSLSVELSVQEVGTEPANVVVNAGWIGEGNAIALKDTVEVQVTDPRVGDKVKARVKKSFFIPRAEELTYQWQVNGEDVDGGTSQSLRVNSMMRGRNLSVLVQASAPHVLDSTIEVHFGVVGLGDAPEYLGDPVRVKGTPQLGQTLRLSGFDADFVYPEADSVDIQWMRGKKPIKGARGLTYELRDVDRDEKVWARITLRKLGHASTVLQSRKKRIEF